MDIPKSRPMHDLKHILAKKKLSLFRNNNSNISRPLQERPKKKRRLRVILPVLVVGLALYPLVFFLVSSKSAGSSPYSAQKSRPSGPLDSAGAFDAALKALSSSRLEGNRLVAPIGDGRSVVYTIDPELQDRVSRVFENYHVPYGAFVAIEPKTGKVLAMVTYSSIDSSWNVRSCYGIYPMASLFKIVTASAALEEKKVSPETVFAFRGRNCSENPKYWFIKPRGNRQMELTTAMGKSVNPVFGRLASDVVGRDAIISMANRYGFNQILFPGMGVTPSKTMYPRDELELRLMGAGLGREVKISPLHAAALMASVANDGVMMTPGLANEIVTPDGKAAYVHQVQPLRQVLAPETARQLAKMLSNTVKNGTSRRVFHDRRGRPMLASINICAKTGTIDGKEPPGHYTWFTAYAPAEDPQIALAALVINKDRWRIKAANVGEQALEAFFK